MFVAKYVFIDEHIALSMFPHQKCIWITNLKKKKKSNAAFEPIVLKVDLCQTKEWVVSRKQLVGKQTHTFQRCSFMIQRFQESYDAKANTICFSEYLILH